MWETLYDMAKVVFGSGITESLTDWMNKVFDSLDKILTSGYVNTIYDVLAPLACSLLVIFFFQDLMNQASKDMFSFEKLVIGFIRMIIAFSLLIFLPDILKLLVDFAQGFVDIVNENFKDEIQSSILGGMEEVFDEKSVRKAYEDEFDHLTKILKILGIMMGLLIPWLIAMFAELMGKFIIASTAIMLLVRITFSPIAVVQIFEEGSRSSGMRYLKSLFGEALSFAVILVIILSANALSADLVGTISGGKSWTNPEDLSSLLTFSSVIPIIVPKLVIAGGMASGAKIAHEVVGA